MDLQYLNTPAYLTGSAESRIGGRAENQDSYGYKQTSLGFLVIVCDGMGGGPGGRTASTIAVNEIIKSVDEASLDEKISNIIIKAIRRANIEIINQGNINPELKGMGSTCTVLMVNENSAIAAFVGDSRIYQFNNHTKIFRTFDHSMVFDLVKQKIITEEQARLSAQSNIITRALGLKLDIEVDIKELSYKKGDRFLLCTDGVHGSMTETELIAMSTNRKLSLNQIVDEIAIKVDGEGRNKGGGHDNLTLILLETKINSILKNKLSSYMKLMIGLLVTTCIISLTGNIWLFNSENLRKENTDTAIYSYNENIKFDSIRIREIESRDSIINCLDEQIHSRDSTLAGMIDMIKIKNSRIEEITVSYIRSN